MVRVEPDARLNRYLKTLGRPLVWVQHADKEPLRGGLVAQIEIWKPWYPDPTYGPWYRLGLVAAGFPDGWWYQPRDFACAFDLDPKTDFWLATDGGVQFTTVMDGVFRFDTPVDGVDDLEPVRRWRSYVNTPAGQSQVEAFKKIWPRNRVVVAMSM